MIKAQELMKHMKEKTQCDYIHLIVEWVSVPHTHMHLIPSMLGKDNAQRNEDSYADGEMEEWRKKIAM
jgi:diadenosine tetraphosphate (Ap4A) HIT family hydrolase